MKVRSRRAGGSTCEHSDSTQPCVELSIESYVLEYTGKTQIKQQEFVEPMCGIEYRKNIVVYICHLSLNPFALYQIKDNPIKWDSFEATRPNNTKVQKEIIIIFFIKSNCHMCLHFVQCVFTKTLNTPKY